MKQPSERQVNTWMKGVRSAMDAALASGISEDSLRKLVQALAKVVHPKAKAEGYQLSAAYESLAFLAGKQVTAKALDACVMRVLANWHFVDEGTEVPEWDGTRTSSDLVVLGLAPAGKDRFGGRRYIVGVRLKTGLCAGIISCGTLSSVQLDTILKHVSGTGTMNCAVEEFSGMKARADVSFDGSMLHFHDWFCSENQKKHNRDLANRRVDVRKCSRAPMPCNACDKTVKECPLAIWLPKPAVDKGGATQALAEC